MEKFTITKDHLKLLKHFYVYWEDGESGAPAIDCKRPYGNSAVTNDIAEILEWELERDEEGYEFLTNEQEILAGELHRETETVLQICLLTQKFKAGTYEKTGQYDNRSWKLIE